MAERFPIIFDRDDDNRLKELPSGDSLNLLGSGIVNASNIDTDGTISASSILIDNKTLSDVAFSGDFNDLDNTPVITPLDWDNISNRPDIPQNIKDLDDVISSQFSSGDVLKYNGVTEQFEPTQEFLSEVVLSTRSITEFADVISVGDTTNRFLKFRAGAWRPTFVEAGDIKKLDEVNLSTFINDAGFVNFADIADEIKYDGDVIGSVYADDSTLLVDGVSGYIPYEVLDGVPTALSDFANDTLYIARSDLFAGGDIEYEPLTGTFSFTERTDQEVRDLFSSAGDLSYDSSIGEFSLVTYKSADFDNDLATKTTDDVTEGTSNLYFLTSRARQSLNAAGDLSYDTETGVFSFNERTDAEIRSLFSASGDLSYNSETGNFILFNRTDNEIRNLFSAGGDLIFDNNTGVFSVTTYKDSDVDSYLQGGTGVFYSNGTISIGQDVGTDKDVIFNQVTVNSDLIVNGTTTTINTETILLSDNIIVLNANYVGTNPTESAGIEVERGTFGNKQFLWNETDNKWTVGTDTFEAEDFEGNLTGSVFSSTGITLVDSDNNEINFINKTTDDLPEGTFNRYYSDSFIESYLGGGVGVTFSDGDISIGQDVGTDRDVTFVRVFADLIGDVDGTVSSLGNQNTSTLAEDPAATPTSGTMYFTEDRARAAISASGDLTYDAQTGVISNSVDILTETDVRGLFTATGDLNYNQSTGEFSLVKYTDTDARQALSVTDTGGDGSLSYDNSTGIFTYIGPSAAEVRAHFSATGDLNYNQSTGEFSVTNYKSSDFDNDLATKTTDDITEGTSNRYFATELVDAHLTGGTGVSYSTGTISIGQAVDTSSDVTFNSVTLTDKVQIPNSSIDINKNGTVGGSTDLENFVNGRLDITDTSITNNSLNTGIFLFDNDILTEGVSIDWQGSFAIASKDKSNVDQYSKCYIAASPSIMAHGSNKFEWYQTSDEGVDLEPNLLMQLSDNVLEVNEIQANLKGNVTGEVIGSIFADDSTLLVDGVNGSLPYVANSPSDWQSPAPQTVAEALDRIAAAVASLGTNP
jgi:hypothetical protein